MILQIIVFYDYFFHLMIIINYYYLPQDRIFGTIAEWYILLLYCPKIFFCYLLPSIAHFESIQFFWWLQWFRFNFWSVSVHLRQCYRLALYWLLVGLDGYLTFITNAICVCFQFESYFNILHFNCNNMKIRMFFFSLLRYLIYLSLHLIWWYDSVFFKGFAYFCLCSIKWLKVLTC